MGRLQNIIEKVIKNIVSLNLIFQLSQFGNDLSQKFAKESLASLNTSLSISLSLSNQFINGGLNFLKGSFYNRLSFSNLCFNCCFDFIQKVNNVSFDLSRFNLGLDIFENVLDFLDNIMDVADGQVFRWFKLISKISKMLTNGWDKIFNGMFQCWFKNIIQKIIKNVVSSKVVFQLSQFSHDLLQKLGEKTLTLFNTSLSLGFDILNSSLDLLKGGFDNGLGSLNSGINSSLQFVKEVNNIILDFTRFNHGLDFIENIFDMLSDLHDISNGQIFNIFTGDKFANEISQVLLDGGDQILNGLAKSGFQHIIQQIIENVVPTNDLVFELSDLGHDFLYELLKDWLDLFNTRFDLINHILNSRLHLAQNFSHHGLGLFDLGLYNIFNMLQKICYFTFNDAGF